MSQEQSSELEYWPALEALGDLVVALFYGPLVLGAGVMLIYGLKYVFSGLTSFFNQLAEVKLDALASDPVFWIALVASVLALYAISYAYHVHKHHRSKDEEEDCSSKRGDAEDA